jgi:CheY-like chemotaxis protein
MTTTGAVLLVEDNPDDVFLMQRAFKKAGIVNPLLVVEDGQEAVDYLSGMGKFSDRTAFPLPALVFLDLKLPYIKGLDVLEWIRKQPGFASLVVVVLTSSSEPSDLSEAYRRGTNSYVVKPPTAGQLVDLAQAFKLYWLEFNRVG